MEKFLVLEIEREEVSALFLHVDAERNILIEEKRRFPFSHVTPQVWEGSRVLAPLRTALRSSPRTVIAAADSKLATTIPLPIDLSRDQPNAKLTLAELENLIAQAMAKIFNGCRSEAARRLGVNDLDAVLVGATTHDFTLDGKAIRTPVGFSGKRISLSLELVFTVRPLFEMLKPLFNAPGNFFFAEAAQARLAEFARREPLPLNLLVGSSARGTEPTTLYIYMKAKDEHEVLYREPLNWRYGDLIEKIKKDFAVDDAAAEEYYCLYHRGAMSDAAARVFKRALEPVLQKLSDELARAKVTGALYVDLPHPLPFKLPHREGPVVFAPDPTADVLKELGFTLPREGASGNILAGEKRNDFLRPLSFFLAAYFDKRETPINQKLRRRLHWLSQP